MSLDDTHNLLLIVVGAHLRAEVADRPLAYRLQRDIRQFAEKHTDAMDANLSPVVCSDLMYLNTPQLRARPTISIGGPGVNAVAAYFAQHLPRDVAKDDSKIILQFDPEFTDLRVCIWGADHPLTARGVALFTQDYLGPYLTAVVNQVEPKLD